MDSLVYQKLRDIIYRESGIALKPDKESFLENRLARRLRALGLSNERQYLQIIESDRSKDELHALLDAISTNTTYFWREERHFINLKAILADYEKDGRKDVKIWCAAASTGEEPYTLAHLALQSGIKNVKVLATDISLQALEKAVCGSYSQEAISKLPLAERSKMFEARDESEPGSASITKSIRKVVVFKRLNLVKTPYPLKGEIDIIFCRNVMIYFDPPVRQRMLDEFSRLLKKDGLLVISCSENLFGLNHNFERIDTSLFKLNR